MDLCDGDVGLNGSDMPFALQWRRLFLDAPGHAYERQKYVHKRLYDSIFAVETHAKYHSAFVDKRGVWLIEEQNKLLYWYKTVANYLPATSFLISRRELSY